MSNLDSFEYELIFHVTALDILIILLFDDEL